jgi:hypothetical protein
MGGKFFYIQERLPEIAAQIEEEAKTLEKLTPEMNFRLNEIIYTIEQLSEMIDRVDLFLSGDENEETFHKKWEEKVRPYFIEEVYREMQKNQELQNLEVEEQDNEDLVRDHFASLVAGHLVNSRLRPLGKDYHKDVAKEAYKIANALMEERREINEQKESET